MNLLTNSRMACAKRCLRKHYYQYELSIRPEEISEPLRIGTGVHDAMEHGKAPILADPVESAIVSGLYEGHQRNWKGREPVYIQREQEFYIPFVDNWTIAGKIDGIIELPDGRLAIYELKTTGYDIEPYADYWKKLRMDAQISLYFLSAQYLGHEVDTVLYDVIRKPGIRVRKGETVQQYRQRLVEDTIAKPSRYFQRAEIPRLYNDLEEFKSELFQQAAFLTWARRNGYRFRNTDACMEPFKCEYLNICHSGLSPSDGVPDGYIRSERHPELSGVPDGKATPTDHGEVVFQPREV